MGSQVSSSFDARDRKTSISILKHNLDEQFRMCQRFERERESRRPWHSSRYGNSQRKDHTRYRLPAASAFEMISTILAGQRMFRNVSRQTYLRETLTKPCCSFFNAIPNEPPQICPIPTPVHSCSFRLRIKTMTPLFCESVGLSSITYPHLTMHTAALLAQVSSIDVYALLVVQTRPSNKCLRSRGYILYRHMLKDCKLILIAFWHLWRTTCAIIRGTHFGLEMCC